MIWDRRRFQSAHFLMLAPPANEVEAVLREMESAYRSVRGYGLDLPSRIIAESYASSSEFRRQTGVGSIYLAATIGERIHLQPPRLLLRSPGLGRALRHELVHVALVRASRSGLPRWVAEGVAMRVAGESYPAGSGIADLAALERCLGEGGGHRAVRGCYGLSRLLVDALVGQIGERKLLVMLDQVGSGNSFAAHFRQITGMTVEEWGRTKLRRK
jgi:hypothetical protein